MIVIGVDVVLLYVIATLFIAAFNRILLYSTKGNENSDALQNKVWENGSTATFSYALLAVWNFTPGSNIPDYPLKFAAEYKGIQWLITLEIFIRQFIVLAITQSTLYFYYQNFYVTNIRKFKHKDPGLYHAVAHEMEEFDGNIHEKVLTELVDKYCENPFHSFANDEDFQVLKVKVLDCAANDDIGKRQEIKFYNTHFQKLIKFRKA